MQTTQMSLSVQHDRGLLPRDRDQIVRGLASPVECRYCHLITGLSAHGPKLTTCHACAIALDFGRLVAIGGTQ